MNASTEAFVIVLLVGSICAIGVLSYKHHQIRYFFLNFKIRSFLYVGSRYLVHIFLKYDKCSFLHRAKLREYEVTQIGPNYDNPMFTGQHTPAERYGSVHDP